MCIFSSHFICHLQVTTMSPVTPTVSSLDQSSHSQIYIPNLPPDISTWIEIPQLQVLLGISYLPDSQTILWLKKNKNTIGKLWVMFYLGQNEDDSLGDSISVLRLLAPKREGDVSINMWYYWREVCAVNHTFWKRLPAILEEQVPPLMISGPT